MSDRRGVAGSGPTGSGVNGCGFLWARALAGESTRARRYLVALRAAPQHVLAPLGSAPEVVDAVLAASSSAWDSVIASLTPMDAWTWPDRLRFGPVLGGLVLTLLAEAHKAAGQLDSAVSYYEKLGSPVEFIRRWEPFASGLAYAFAHQRLVVLYARMDRIDDAERHWKIFRETFTDPDPSLVHLVDEALEALQEAKAG